MMNLRPMRLNLGRFAHYRTDAGLSLAGVAREAGVNRSSLYRAMYRENRTCSHQFMVRLMTVFPFVDLFEPVPTAAIAQRADRLSA